MIFQNITNAMNSLNNSKYLAGVIMIVLNIGSKYIDLNLTPSMENYLKHYVARELLIFSVAWLGTRDIVASIVLTASFVVLSDVLLNANSNFCVLPEKCKLMNSIDKNKDGIISDVEISKAIQLLEKAKKQKQDTRNQSLLNYYHDSKM